MSSPEERIQVLYEISLSVGVGNGLTEMARTALSTYLQKLNCSAGAIFERSANGGVSYETVTMIPSKAAVGDGFRAAMERLSELDEPLSTSLPITAQPADGITYYLMSLPEFGVLLLVVRGQPLDSETVAALHPLNEKLATACLSERYQAQIREERDRFEAVFTTIEEPLASVRPSDGALIVERLNPAFETTFGCTESDAVGRELAALLDTTSSDSQLPSLADAGEPDVSTTTELRCETTAGPGEFLFRSAPINPDRDRTEHLALFVDVTGERERQRRLEKLYDVTQVLARILRHNIRNDLTVIQSAADRIRRTANGEVAADAETIMQKSEELHSTAEKAREIRQVVGHHEPRSPIPVEAAIGDGIDRAQPSADGQISVDAEVSDTATVHPSISVAVQHLVENGIEHHSADADGSETSEPHVWVSAEETASGIRIEVRDNGPGIPEAEAAMMDSPGETALQHGSGAGLWIVSQIIDYCDATIEFSVDEIGTTATIFVAD